MAHIKIKFLPEEDNEPGKVQVCLDSPGLVGGGDTLCGIGLSVHDSHNGVEKFHATNERISCPHCLAIIKHCKAVENRQFKPPS